ncbi:MAG: hypothetical protein FJ284_15995, partial [Planctomycetes bacterium]|nr:hypothetical protein [Planctomycetota bacterium]
MARGWWIWGIVVTLVLLAPSFPALVAAEPTAANPRVEFQEAFGRLKKLMADMTVMQAQYQQPKADKAALEAKFEATKREAEAAGGRLETAAAALLAVEPQDAAAREIASAAMAGALQADDPARGLTMAAALEAADAIDADAALLAATAALVLSRLDEAGTWLDRAV